MAAFGLGSNLPTSHGRTLPQFLIFFPHATFFLFYSAGTRMSGKNLSKATVVISDVLMLEFVSIPVCRVFTALYGFT